MAYNLSRSHPVINASYSCSPEVGKAADGCRFPFLLSEVEARRELPRGVGWRDPTPPVEVGQVRGPSRVRRRFPRWGSGYCLLFISPKYWWSVYINRIDDAPDINIQHWEYRKLERNWSNIYPMTNATDTITWSDYMIDCSGQKSTNGGHDMQIEGEDFRHIVDRWGRL